MMRSPILFLVFNRPDTTKRVFDAIRAARPPRLYIAADGPRPDRAGEAELCESARRIASNVDWPCEVRTLLRSENLGCKRAVSSAVTWFFECEPEGIVLEDDCLPHHSFFEYCDELLERYRDNPHVMCISGDNFISADWVPSASYYFSRYMHIWGWASWRRAWRYYDVDMSDWKDNRTNAQFWARCISHAPQSIGYWQNIFDKVFSGQLDTWDYQWTYACFKQQGLSCMPGNNLISNIGFGKNATHTTSPEGKLADLAAVPIAMPLKHPESVEAADIADTLTNDHVFEIGNMNWTFARIRRAINNRIGWLWGNGG
ncbi:MAG: hypothetical protein QM808_13195 [Steroidobacteraceae bacterium]